VPVHDLLVRIGEPGLHGGDQHAHPLDSGSQSGHGDVLSLTEGRWATLIIRDLLAGPKRFGELRASLRGISPKTLTDRLRHLERHGIVTRHRVRRGAAPGRVPADRTRRQPRTDPARHVAVGQHDLTAAV
jgi:DNA-binding HxlR family transcriptional regulator